MRILHTESSRGWGGQAHRILAEACGMVTRGRLRAAAKRVMPIRRVPRALERRGFRSDRCPFVIANSELNRQGILRYYPIAPERAVVAYTGVDATRFSPAARDTQRARATALWCSWEAPLERTPGVYREVTRQEQPMKSRQ